MFYYWFWDMVERSCLRIPESSESTKFLADNLWPEF